MPFVDSYTSSPAWEAFNYFSTLSNFVWSICALLLMLFHVLLSLVVFLRKRYKMKQRKIPPVPITLPLFIKSFQENLHLIGFLFLNATSYIFTLTIGLGMNYFAVQYDFSFDTMYREKSQVYLKFMEASSYLIAIATILTEFSWALLVVHAKKIHRNLRLKQKKWTNYWLFLIVLQLIILLSITTVQNEILVDLNGASLNLCDIAVFFFSFLSLIVFTIMYISFRNYILSSKEMNLQIFLSSSQSFRLFGWFVMAYALHVFFNFFLAISALMDWLGEFSDFVLFIHAFGYLGEGPARFWAFFLAFIFYKPHWAEFINAPTPQLDIEAMYRIEAQKKINRKSDSNHNNYNNNQASSSCSDSFNDMGKKKKSKATQIPMTAIDSGGNLSDEEAKTDIRSTKFSSYSLL